MNFNKTYVTRLFWLAVLLFSTNGLLADEHPTFPVGEFTFTRPAKWEWVQPTWKIRKAQLKVTDAASKSSADVVFYLLGAGAPGGVEGYVDRWLKQFAEPRDQINAKVEHTSVGGSKLTYVQADGTYNRPTSGGPPTPMPGYALIGAILESDGGNVYIHMTGPKALVKSAITDFKKMTESASKKD